MHLIMLPTKIYTALRNHTSSKRCSTTLNVTARTVQSSCHICWNVAKIKNQLIAFPGHESLGVKLSEDIKGVGYRNDKEVYYIADPTYIGASVGACMPTYIATPPTVDLTIPTNQ